MSIVELIWMSNVYHKDDCIMLCWTEIQLVNVITSTEANKAIPKKIIDFTFNYQNYLTSSMPQTLHHDVDKGHLRN